MELPEIQLGDSIPVNEVIAVTARLTDVLRLESEYLRVMNIREAGKLQDEKIRLTSWLEAQQKLISIRPELRDFIAAEERKAMEEVAVEFADAVEDNFRQVSIARVVNQKVVQAITDAMREQNSVATYNAQGANSTAGNASLSYNLNQRA